MNIYTDNKLQESKRIAIDNNNFNKTEHFDLSAISSGKMRIRVELVAEINENNETNNSESVFTDVLDSKQKVLILANSPHPDVSALRQAISGFKNYEGSYSKGKPHGTWTFYDLDGSRLKDVLFEHGEKIKEIVYKEGVPFNPQIPDSVQFRVN